jgi:hypothetical protein
LPDADTAGIHRADMRRAHFIATLLDEQPMKSAFDKSMLSMTCQSVSSQFIANSGTFDGVVQMVFRAAGRKGEFISEHFSSIAEQVK